MQDKYCLPILKESKDSVIETIGENLDSYGYFEIWLDYIEDLDDDFISQLVSSYARRLVFVLRRKPAEATSLKLERIKEIINILAKSESMIDLDVKQQKDELDYLKTVNKTLQLIGSYHNYEITPPDGDLIKIVEEIKAYSPEIIKIATMCNNASDSFRLIKIKVDFLENNQKHIVLGMGEEGKITRVFGALWGNALIFIPQSNGEASAPGQITREEFDKIMERIKK